METSGRDETNKKIYICGEMRINNRGEIRRGVREEKRGNETRSKMM